MIQDGVTYRIIKDHLGSPRLVVDANTGDVAIGGCGCRAAGEEEREGRWAVMAAAAAVMLGRRRRGAARAMSR